MDRLRRLVVIVAAIGLLLTTVAPVGAAQAEDYARVIRSRHAGATFVQVDGCTQTEVFVSAMDAVFGSRPGPVNKQGLVGVFYRELDICSGPGPRFPVVFSADAQSLDRLVSSPRFGTASIDVTPVGDGRRRQSGRHRPPGRLDRRRVRTLEGVGQRVVPRR